MFTSNENEQILTATVDTGAFRENAEPLEALLYESDKARACFACPVKRTVTEY